MIRLAFFLSVLLSASANAQFVPNIQYRYTNWVIDNDSVCFNYKKGSVEHRECRRAASIYFRAQCYSNKQLDATVKQMFCRATYSYNPL